VVGAGLAGLTTAYRLAQGLGSGGADSDSVADRSGKVKVLSFLNEGTYCSIFTKDIRDRKSSR